MKKRATTVIAAALAFTLAVPMVTGTDSSAAAKAPKLTPRDGATIITGKTQTFKIKNVKASNVKSLKVKIGQPLVAELVSKTKTSFVIKGVGGGMSDLEVVLKLKKAQAGKKVYKFERLNIQAGSDAVPQVRLTDAVSEGVLTAMVLKAGSKVDFDKIDNELVLDVANRDDIGGRNMMLFWYEDGVQKDEWCRDGAGGYNYRPDTENVVIEQPALPATGPAVSGSGVDLDPNKGFSYLPSPSDVGLIETHIYHTVVVNELSQKAAITRPKLVRIVPEFFISMAIERFNEFNVKYPVGQADAILTDNAKQMKYALEFKNAAHGLGICLGMTDAVVDDMLLRMRNKDANLPDLNTTVFKPYFEKIKKTGEYLGITEQTITDFFRHFSYIAHKSLTDNDLSIDILDFR